MSRGGDTDTFVSKKKVGNRRLYQGNRSLKTQEENRGEKRKRGLLEGNYCSRLHFRGPRRNERQLSQRKGGQSSEEKRYFDLDGGLFQGNETWGRGEGTAAHLSPVFR